MEDTNATEEEILSLSNENVLEAVRLLTFKKGDDKGKYVSNILKNDIAKAVKNADRIHNLIDAINTKDTFIRSYIENTEKYYVGKFSKELDAALNNLKRIYARNKSCYYVKDSSVNNSPIYRVSDTKKEAWVWRGTWIPTDYYFFLNMGDNAISFSYDELPANIK